MQAQRAYSAFVVKAMDKERRTFSGWATTPAVDRYLDSINPLGAKFKNPLVLLHQHSSQTPIGRVTFKKPTSRGIEFDAEIPVVEEDGDFKRRVDTAWAEIRYGVVRSVSIGFMPLKYSYKNDGGIDFEEIEIYELSTVSVPALPEAVITSVKAMNSGALSQEVVTMIKALDTSVRRAASGQASQRVVRFEPLPGASGQPAAKPKPQEGKLNIKEQIQKLEATRAAKQARLTALTEKVGAEGRTKDESEKEEFDTLMDEVKSIDTELKDLSDMETVNLTTLKPVVKEVVETTKSAAEVRGGRVISVERNLPKGTAFTRYVMALVRAKGNLMHAAEIAKVWKDTPDVEMVLKAAVAAGTTTDPTWAGPLVYYQNLVTEFIELLRPLTIIGRIAGFRRVPFNIRMPRQTAGGSYGWVGEGKPKPVGKLSFDEFRLGHAKAAGIIVISEELARESSPSAEQIVRQDMLDGMAAFLDEQFINPDVAEVSNVSPASVLNGVTPVTATGTDADAFRANAASMWATMLAAGLNPAGGHWVMSNVQAMRLGLMRNALSQKEFPDINANGGTLEGFPVVASQTSTLDSNGEQIAFIVPREIFLAEEGLVIDVSREASVQMNSTPDDPASASTVLVSLWQNNLVGLRAERFINWKKRRAEAAGFIQGANYA